MADTNFTRIEEAIKGLFNAHAHICHFANEGEFAFAPVLGHIAFESIELAKQLEGWLNQAKAMAAHAAEAEALYGDNDNA